MRSTPSRASGENLQWLASSQYACRGRFRGAAAERTRTGEWLWTGGLEQLDQVSGGVLDEDLTAAGAGHHVVAERDSLCS